MSFNTGFMEYVYTIYTEYTECMYTITDIVIPWPNRHTSSRKLILHRDLHWVAKQTC